ncbi:hypothetical protein BDV26DRAFT_264498 [Aspergillus bertholletiae]|uniref:Uncharacterized protein n=1 Tax=Aspergillus bertholletiae TaxID=1226010 RepID=A0A5N7B4I8_9EURO|nr:hypothetical protein BDV26DRAFT_264498 [Aspergillus bertholletiae]
MASRTPRSAPFLRLTNMYLNMTSLTLWVCRSQHQNRDSNVMPSGYLRQYYTTGFLRTGNIMVITSRNIRQRVQVPVSGGYQPS